MTTPVSEAIRLLREAADYYEQMSHVSRLMGPSTAEAPLMTDSREARDAADALAAYFAEPTDAEVERLARSYWTGHESAIQAGDLHAMRAVLKAIGGDPE